MIASAYYNRMISKIYITRDAEEYPAAKKGRDFFRNKPVITINTREEIPREDLSFRTLLITKSRGKVLGRCPGSKGHRCCNYLTLDLYIGCGIGCTYCAMRGYLNFAPQIVQADTETGIRALKETAKLNPNRTIRAGTGEVGDSLLFDPVFRLTRDYIESAADLSNVYFETKSKTHFVDHLLSIPKKGNAVLGFSLNPQRIIEVEEGLSSSLRERLRAALKSARAGYLVSFHFDPVIGVKNWKTEYDRVIKELDQLKLPPGKIAWISLGTFRYTKKLKEVMNDRPYLMQEFVPCLDGKFRYLQKIRVDMYRYLIEELSKVTDAPVYLCMESDVVWNKLFGAGPGEIPRLSDIFTPEGSGIVLPERSEEEA